MPKIEHVSRPDDTSASRIVIGICARGRDALLRRLIDSIWSQPKPVGYAVELVIVDNNDTACAEAALQGLPARFPITVVHEPRAGLVFARNRALDEAVARDAAWFVGVDDDEWVAQDWLAMMIKGIATMEREIIIGRCDYIYDDTLSPYVKPKQVVAREKGRRPPVPATGNFALHRSVFDPKEGPGLRFDPYFNERGGEDTEFFRRTERKYKWVPASLLDAIVFEECKGVRATLRYRLYRSLRTQLTVHQVARRHRMLGIYGSRAKNALLALRRLNFYLFNGILDLIAGVAMLPFGLPKAQLRLGSAMERGVRALAIVMFVFGASIMAYGKPDGASQPK
ncbi:MAG: glycosyltransferase family 2 protein [Pseudomonadota bacterium]